MKLKKNIKYISDKKNVHKIKTRVKGFEAMIIQLAELDFTLSQDHTCKCPVNVYTNKFIKLVTHNGLPYTIKYMKSARHCVYKYLSGDPLDRYSNISLTSDGIPTFLQDWIPLIRSGNEVSQRVVLSILLIGRLFTSVGNLDTRTITRPYTGKLISDVISDHEIEEFVNNNNLSISEIPQPELWLRTSSGPVGPAMTSIIHEARNLPDNLYKIICKYLTQDQVEILDQCRNDETPIPPDLKQSNNSLIRKITVVEDKEGKDRVIAIFDYWSQMVLKPLHDTLMSKVKSLEQDATYDQTGAVMKLRKEGPYYSLDLSSATDRLPALLSKRLLVKMVGQDNYPDDVFTILNGQDFWTQNGNIKYSVGQPMGAYASWSLLALTHHLIVYTAMMRSKSSLDQYILLGDDLVISGRDFSNCYKEIIYLLGMEISKEKTIESNDSFEFAKRFFINSKEMSPLPIGQLKHASSTYWDVVGFIDQSESRGWKFSANKARKLLCYHIFKGLPKRKFIYMSNLVDKYYYSINPWKDDWHLNIRWKMNKMFPLEFWGFSCSASEDFLRQFYLEHYIHVTMNFIHVNIVNQVKSFNKYARNPWYTQFKEENGYYHPIITILHAIASKMNEIEYNVSSNPIDETERYYRMNVKLSQFTLLPSDISKVTSLSNHSKNQRARAYLNNNFEKLISEINIQREKILGCVLEDTET